MKRYEPIRASGRRRLLRGLAALPLLAMTSVRPTAGMDGSFLQLWPSHLDLSRAQWRERLRQTRGLGCRDLVLQWVGLSGKSPAWQLPQATLKLLLDEAQRAGLSVQVGLPYDERWWDVIADEDTDALRVFLAQTEKNAADFMRTATFTGHRAFRGWYIPYEIEQFNWANPQRQAMLAQWLARITQARGNANAPGISTYYSRLPGEGKLASLWGTVLERAELRPMIQDGVGVAGLDNYDALAPLARALRARGTQFDLIVELFEELPPATSDGTTFNAVAADFGRVQTQLNIARHYGAERVLGFAADPWLLGDTPQAKQLYAAWRRTYG